MFIDKVIVQVKAGDGGDGIVSWRHEKFIDRGGPNGGDGGRGGDVIFVADRNTNTLVDFRYKQEIKAEDGKNGSDNNKKGKSGEDVFVKVPIGTQIYEDEKLLVDLVVDGQKAKVALGGDGGFGNAHFKSSTRQAPKVAELGEKGEQKMLTLELKLLADVGLIGFPNAGKSTLLSVISNAKPEIGDYAFTTLTPNLGVVDIDGQSMLFADIPGLIEGASQGKGLGDEFLRHVERTQVLLHLIDIYEDDVATAYKTIKKEIKSYSGDLGSRRSIVALTKVEGLDPATVKQKIDQVKRVVENDEVVLPISAAAGLGIKDILRRVLKMVLKAREENQPEVDEDTGLPVISLNAEEQALAWKVEKIDKVFVVSGRKIEKFAARTNFDTEPGIRRLKDIMKKMGIMHELERQGLGAGDEIVFGKLGSRAKFTF